MNKPTRFEKEILKELNEITGVNIYNENLMEWSTLENIVDDNLQPKEGEQKIYCPGLGVWCAVSSLNLNNVVINTKLISKPKPKQK